MKSPNIVDVGKIPISRYLIFELIAFGATLFCLVSIRFLIVTEKAISFRRMKFDPELELQLSLQILTHIIVEGFLFLFAISIPLFALWMWDRTRRWMKKPSHAALAGMSVGVIMVAVFGFLMMVMSHKNWGEEITQNIAPIFTSFILVLCPTLHAFLFSYLAKRQTLRDVLFTDTLNDARSNSPS